MPVLVGQRKRSGNIAPPRWPDPFGGDDPGGRAAFPISSGYLAMWVLLTAVTMLFAGLTSAYIVLRGAPNWQNITLPPMVWVNTLVLLASSLSIEFSRWALKRMRPRPATQWLIVSGVLGLAFLAGQVVVWRQLVQAGVYLATNLHSSFFYVLTASHGIHLAGGLVGLILVLRSAFTGGLTAASHEPLRVWALYWHFMDGIWLYLFLLLLLA